MDRLLKALHKYHPEMAAFYGVKPPVRITRDENKTVQPKKGRRIDRDRLRRASIRYEENRKRWEERQRREEAESSIKHIGEAAKIISEVARGHDIMPNDILGKSRTARCVIPRQHAMYRIREELGYSYPKIGRIFQCDHTSVVYAVSKYRRVS